MRHFFLALFIVSFAATTNGQITGGNWMVGGQGSFVQQDGDLGWPTVKKTTIILSTDIGYFFIDRLAGGLKGSFNYSKAGSNGNYSKVIQLGIGPFVRYYFLHTEKKINIFAETCYQYAHYNDRVGTFKYDQNVFKFSAGPAVFFNPSVGLELTANYEISGITKKIFMGIGFQIHLEKDRK